MIQIITDGKTFTVDKASDLTAAQLAVLFPSDLNPDVLLTYVITNTSQSRRVAPK